MAELIARQKALQKPITTPSPILRTGIQSTPVSTVQGVETDDFTKNYVKPPFGDQWIARADYDKLTPYEKSIYDRQGFTSLKDYLDKKNQALPETPSYEPSALAPDSETLAIIAHLKSQKTVLQQKLADYKKLKTQEPDFEGALPPDYYYEIDRSIDTLESQLNIADEALNTMNQGKTYTAEGVKSIANLTDPEMLSYITAKDGQFTVNTEFALQRGVSKDKLLDMGVSSKDIQIAEARNELKQFKVGQGYDIAKAIKAGKIDTVREAGFNKDAILEAQMAVANPPEVTQEVTDWSATDLELNKYLVKSDVPYKVGSEWYDIARYLRDHNDDDSALVAANFTPESIAEARTYNAQPWRQTTAQDRIYLAAYRIGLDLTGQQSPEEMQIALNKDPSFINLPPTDPKVIGLKAPMSERAFTANFVAARIDQPEYSSLGDKATVTAILKGLATREYMRLYGKGTALASQGTDVLTVVAPAFKALHPEYTIKDVTGAEWALSAANIALLVVTPILGKVAGAGVKAISGVKSTVEVGAALTYPFVTATQWSKMSTTERILNVAIDTTIAGAILGRPVMSAFKQLVPGIGFESRVEALARATRSGDATKVWVAGDRLEAYGRALENAGVKTGTRIAEQGKFVKSNAYAISRPSVAGVNRLNPIIDDLRTINNEMALLRQRGAYAIDPKTGKVIDTDTGEVMTQAKQVARIREARVGTLPITRAEANTFGLTDTELDEIFKIAGNDRELFLKLAREKAAKNAKAMDIWNKSLEESAKKYEREQAQREIGGVISGEGVEIKPVHTEKEIAESWAEHMRSWEAEKQALIEQAAREVSRERAYQIMFPTTRTSFPESGRMLPIPQQATVLGAIAYPFDPKKYPDRAREFEKTLREIQIMQGFTVEDTNAINKMMGRRIDELSSKMTREQAIKQALQEFDSASKTDTKEETKTKLKEFTKEKTKEETKTAVLPTTETKTKIVPQPQTATKTKIEIVPQTQTATETQTKTITQPQVQPKTSMVVIPEPATITVPDEVSTIKEVTKKEITYGIPKPSKIKEKVKVPEWVLTERPPIAWKQGIVWYTIYPEYNKKTDIKITRKPPVGAYVTEGIGSAYKTIQALGGNADIVLTIKIGFMKATITRPRRGGQAPSTIKFTPMVSGVR